MQGLGRNKILFIKNIIYFVMTKLILLFLEILK